MGIDLTVPQEIDCAQGHRMGTADKDESKPGEVYVKIGDCMQGCKESNSSIDIFELTSVDVAQGRTLLHESGQHRRQKWHNFTALKIVV